MRPSSELNSGGRPGARVVMVAAPAPALTAADARQAAARKEEEDDEEVVCFICFDGGDLVVCDWRCDAAVRDFFHAWMVIERAPPDCSQCRRRLQAAESRSFPPVRFLSVRSIGMSLIYCVYF